MNFNLINRIFMPISIYFFLVFNVGFLISQVESGDSLTSVEQGTVKKGASSLLGQMPSFEDIEKKGDDLQIDSMKDFYQEMIKIWVEAKKREEERKLLYFSKLSEEHQEVLKKSQDQFTKFLEIVDIRSGLGKLCDKLYDKLDVLTKKVSANSDVILQETFKKLEKLKIAITLDYCSFLPKRMDGMSAKGIEDLSGVMNGLMQNLLPEQGGIMEMMNHHNAVNPDGDMEDPELIFSVQDASDLREILEKLLKSNLFKNLKTDSDELITLRRAVKKNIGIFLDILTAILHQKPQELILPYVTYIEPEFQSSMSIFKDTRSQFENEIKLLISNQSSELLDSSEKDQKQKAYMFWLKEIKKNQRTLMAFSTLKNASTSSFVGTGKLFEIMAYAYDVANCMYDFYKKDMKVKYPNMWFGFSHKDVLIPNVFDWAFRSGFAAWAFFEKRPMVSGGLLYNSIMGNMPLNMIDLKQTTMFNFMIMPFAAMTFCNPSVGNWQLPKLVKSFGNIVGAWFYYHLIYCQLFGPETGDPLWPTTNKHIKGSIYNFLIDVELEMSKQFSSIVRSNMDPILLENVENYTLGVVKPEMIGVFISAITPVILFRNNYLGFDLPMREFVNCDQAFFNSLIGSNVVANYEKLDPGTKSKIALEGYYLETCVIYYISSSVGKTLGTAFVKKYQSSLIKAASYVGEKCVNGLAKLNLISEDTAQLFSAFKDEFTEGIEENIMILKMLFKELFSQNSQLKMLLVDYLYRRGDIVFSSDVSEEEIDRKVAFYVLSICAKHEWISHLDAARINGKYIKKQQFDDELIDEFILALKNHLFASVVGGSVGQWFANFGAKVFLDYYGPVSPKFRDLVHSSKNKLLALPC